MFLIEKILLQKFGIIKYWFPKSNKKYKKNEIEFYQNEHISFRLYDFLDILWIAKRKTKWR